MTDPFYENAIARLSAFEVALGREIDRARAAEPPRLGSLRAQQLAELDARMGVTSLEPSVRRHGSTLVFGMHARPTVPGTTAQPSSPAAPRAKPGPARPAARTTPQQSARPRTSATPKPPSSPAQALTPKHAAQMTPLPRATDRRLAELDARLALEISASGVRRHGTSLIFSPVLQGD